MSFIKDKAKTKGGTMSNTRIAKEVYLNSTVFKSVANRKTFKADTTINDCAKLIDETLERVSKYDFVTNDDKREIVNWVLGFYSEDFENWFTNQKLEIYKYTDKKLQENKLGIAPSFI